MSRLFEFRNLTHHYKEHRTLSIDSLEIEEGAVTGLIGPNGSGKSTLLKIAACLLERTGGEFLYDGAPADGREREIRREVTLLLQEPFLLKRSVRENIAYGLRLRGIGAEERDARGRDALARVGLAWDDFARRPWYRLSGGEAQRAALAVRLALRPRALLLDEPTASVDDASAELIKEAVRRERDERGTTVIISTHDTAWLAETASVTVSLRGGRVEA